MTLPKIDPTIAAVIRAKILDCERRGSDVIRALNELGFLRHEQRMRHDQAWILDKVADGLDGMSVAQLFDKPLPTTSYDTKKGIVEILRLTAENWRNGAKEPL